MRWMRKSIAWISGFAIGGFLLWIVGTAVSIQSMQAESVGTLFGRRVALNAYVNALQAVTHHAILTQGEKGARALSREELDRRAWERLAMATEAKTKRIRVSNKEVVEEISSWPLFHQKDGRFDQSAYEMILQYTLGTNPRTFEEETRETLMINKLIEQVAGKVRLTQEDLMEPVAAKPRKVTEDELLAKKRLAAYLGWYGDLLKRANPKKETANHKQRATRKTFR